MTRHDDQSPTSIPRPTLRSRLLGAELRRVREAAGLTVPEFAALVDQEPDTVRRQESGISADLSDIAPAESEVWCPWGTLATSVINLLCRNANRIDIFAPLGIHPALERLGPDRCTAYVLEDAVVDRHDVTVRLIRRGAGVYPGIEHHPLIRFGLPDSAAVVLYPYLHAAHFTEEEQHLLAAYRLFEELAESTDTAYPA
jgi:transcriptional regulator with XRE-family HTH domain